MVIDKSDIVPGKKSFKPYPSEHDLGEKEKRKPGKVDPKTVPHIAILLDYPLVLPCIQCFHPESFSQKLLLSLHTSTSEDDV